MIIFNEYYKDDEKDAPYDTLTDVVREYCTNLKSCISNVRNGHQKSFEMKPKNKERNSRSMFISCASINKNGLFVRLLGKIKELKHYGDKINHDCRLVHDRKLNEYYLKALIDIPTKYIEKENKDVCGIDPGEKVFINYYGLKKRGEIGNDIRKEILNKRKAISYYQRIRERKTKIYIEENKSKRNIKKFRKKIDKKIYSINKNMKNFVKELHNKSANYLCKNFSKIYLPKFETQNMVSNKDKIREIVKKNLNEIRKNANGDNIEKIKKYKIYKKRSLLSKKVKYVLLQLSHYTFKKHLISKANEYGCNVVMVTEEYTSQACGKCGALSKTYNGRTKKCIRCNYEINRDVNGSRNILIKNLPLL